MIRRVVDLAREEVIDVRRHAPKARNGSPFVIPRALTNGKDLVVLTREEYERNIRLSGKILHTLQVIAEGERAHREGRTVKSASLDEALRQHARRSG